MSGPSDSPHWQTFPAGEAAARLFISEIQYEPAPSHVADEPLVG